jgi:hypothetical protein
MTGWKLVGVIEIFIFLIITGFSVLVAGGFVINAVIFEFVGLLYLIAGITCLKTGSRTDMNRTNIINLVICLGFTGIGWMVGITLVAAALR